MADRLNKSGKKILTHELDLRDTENPKKVVEEVKGQGLIDILLNNAGFDRPGTTAKIDTKGFSDVLNIHIVVPLTLIHLLLPDMRKAGWGRIINISSIYGLISAKGEIAYSTAKAGIIGLTKSVAKEAGSDGVTVNTVLAGLTRTPTIERFMAESVNRMK